MKNTCQGIVLFLTLICIALTTSQAQMYKWVDEYGNTHYSDRNPDQANSSTITPDLTPSQQAVDRTTRLTPLILPHGKTSRPLILSDAVLSWRQTGNHRQKLGVYYLGRFCTSRGAMYAPDIYTYHPGFIPTEMAIPIALKKAIDNLGYATHTTLPRDLHDRMQRKDGLYLEARIHELDLHSCAPLHSLTRTISPKKISASSFTKNRAAVSVEWALFAHLDQDPLFTAVTQGYSDNWNSQHQAARTIIQALVVATNNLFAEQAFIDLITYEAQAAVPDQAPSQSANEATGWWNNFLPGIKSPLSNLINNQFVLRAKLSGVLAEAATLKVSAVSYFMAHNEWPSIIQDIGLSDRLFDQHEYISGLNLHRDGSFSLDLREEVFGPSRVLRMTPDTDSYLERRSLHINWSCSSNLPAEVLPDNCAHM